MQVFESILVTLAALLPIVNPLGTAPIFLAMSADLPAGARRHLATVVARNAFVLLTSRSRWCPARWSAETSAGRPHEAAGLASRSSR